MTVSSPSPEAIRFIARILAARPTAVAEVAETIANIARTIDSLGPSAVVMETAPAVRPAITPAVPLAAEAAPVAKPKAVRIAAPRGRPRLRPKPAIEEPTVESDPEPAPQPRLLRRAEIVHAEHDPAAALQPIRSPGTPVRGVVKWFDGKTGKGALRLTGISGDVALERVVLEQSAIKRLYKDQEIEAIVQDQGRGRVRLVSLNLPGRNTPAAGGLFGSENGSPARRPARSVMVEVKRDGARASSAREEAENVFGGPAHLRSVRRMPSK